MGNDHEAAVIMRHKDQAMYEIAAAYVRNDITDWEDRLPKLARLLQLDARIVRARIEQHMADIIAVGRHTR